MEQIGVWTPAQYARPLINNARSEHTLGILMKRRQILTESLIARNISDSINWVRLNFRHANEKMKHVYKIRVHW